MPPKRRKISVGSEAEQCEGETQSSYDRDLSTAQDASPVECMDTDVTNLGSLVSSLENKPKDDILKPTRISKRLIIKRNRCVDEEDPKDKVQAKPVRQATPRKPRSSASARQTKQTVDSAKNKGQKAYGYWSLADKRTFFLGLQQYGKNFEAISKKISQSAKMRGFAPKDKVQVQYFYYRNWRKIAKFVDMKGTDVPMKTQELYGLINYGVLNKYVKENDPLFGECLNNLIHHGETTFMRKFSKDNRKSRCGKLRTPVCTCLKKINRLIDVNSSQSTSSHKLPQAISIELTPRNSKAWAKVQCVSQNPRLRIKVPSSRTLESVIKFLIKKWKPQRTKNKEKFGASEESRENLVMFLHPNTKIFPVSLIARQNEKVDVSFSNYKQNVLPMLKIEKKSQTTKGSDKTSGLEKEKDKSSNEPVQEQGNINNSKAQCAVLSSSDSSHSQKSEEKLTLFIPENKFPDGNFSPQQAENFPLDNQKYQGKTLPCSSPTVLSKDRLVNSPKALYPASVLLDDENAMFPDSTGPFSPSSLSSSKPQSDVCLSPLIMSQQASPGPLAEVTSPSVGKKKRVGGRNTKKGSTAADGILPGVCEAAASSPMVFGSEVNSTSSTSPVKQQDGPGPPLAGYQDQSPHKDSQQEISRLTRLATEEGFTALNSHTVTLLHLSLLLGRETLVRLQYEWREKRPVRGPSGPGYAAGVAAMGGMMQVPPLLGQAAGQMSNLLRRLCNLATLELTDFVRDSELKTSKASSVAFCSRCSTSAASTSTSSSMMSTSGKGSSARTRRQSLLNQAEKQLEKVHDEADNTNTSVIPETKDTGIQTDLPTARIPFPFPGLPAPTVHLSQTPGLSATVTLPGNVQVLQPASVVTAGGQTFVAGPHTAAGTQVNGGDQVFRVPLIPTFRDAARVEQMKQEQQRRLQETAKTILEQGSNQRKLLKRRRVINKKKKDPPVIVQRTLMPKLDAGEVVTYIQQPAITPGSNTVLYSLNPADPMMPRTVASHPVHQPTVNSLGSAAGLTKQAQAKSAAESQLQKSNDILRQAALDAEINLNDGAENSQVIAPVVKPLNDESDETKTFGPKPLSEEVAVTRSEGSGNLGSNTISSVVVGNTATITSNPNSQLSMNADISMSDFDISLTGVPVSNMGPDAGDKFLDLVLQNSEQGFSGLLNTPKKSTSTGSTLPVFTSSSSPLSTTNYDARILRTPTHFGSAAPVGLITPVKLDLDQDWGAPLAVGDISLSNILEDSSTFRTGPEQKSPNGGRSTLLPAQIDVSSNDGFLKHTSGSDLTFSSLLGDPSFRKDDDSTCGLSPPLSSAALASSLPSSVSISGTSCATTLTAPAGRRRGAEEGRGSTQLFSEVSQDSFTTKLDVESSLHSIMVSESSLDLVSKFEALAGGVTQAGGSQNLTNNQQHSMSGTLAEDVALGVSMGPLSVSCREGAVDSHTVKLESPSAS